MKDQIREQVSALLDGELSRDEIGLLVRRMERDPQLRGSFGRYSLIGEALRAPGGEIARPAFAARVSAAIALPADPAAAGVPVAARHTAFWKRPAFATAIAAGFALLAIMVVRPFAGPETATVTAQAQAVIERSPLAGAVSPTPAQSQRLAGYLVAHSQYSSQIARRSVWSGLLAADPGLQRVSYEVQDAP
jgi:sigma-E factor negative regulatory protein RseA